MTEEKRFQGVNEICLDHEHRISRLEALVGMLPYLIATNLGTCVLSVYAVIHGGVM